MGDGAFGTGERYERLAAYGAPRGNLPWRNGKNLDCNWPFHRDGLELEAGLSQAEDLYGKNQRDNTALLFRGAFQRPDRPAKANFSDNNTDFFRHIRLFRTCGDGIVI